MQRFLNSIKVSMWVNVNTPRSQAESGISVTPDFSRSLMNRSGLKTLVNMSATISRKLPVLRLLMPCTQRSRSKVPHVCFLLLQLITSPLIWNIYADNDVQASVSAAKSRSAYRTHSLDPSFLQRIPWTTCLLSSAYSV